MRRYYNLCVSTTALLLCTAHLVNFNTFILSIDNNNLIVKSVPWSRFLTVKLGLVEVRFLSRIRTLPDLESTAGNI
jgi:hypothetical protein